MKKLEGYEAENIRMTTVEEDVEHDLGLMNILKRAKRDIRDKNFYTSDELRGMIRRGNVEMAAPTAGAGTVAARRRGSL